MKKIEKLTPQQEKDLIEFRQKWFEIGTSTAPADWVSVEEVIAFFYQKMGKKKPAIIRMSSPMTAQLLLNYFEINKDKTLKDVLGLSLRASLVTSLGASLGASLYDSLRDSLGASLYHSLDAHKLKYVPTFLWGSLDSYWISFYLFGKEIGVKYKKEDLELLNQWAKLAQSCLCWYPFENQVLVCDRPESIRMKGEWLHCDGGPSVKFRDGWSIWSLNGIPVSQELAETPADQLSCQLMLKEKNADIRREIVRKIGMERIVKELNAKVIDRYKDYELLEEVLD